MGKWKNFHDQQNRDLHLYDIAYRFRSPSTVHVIRTLWYLFTFKCWVRAYCGRLLGDFGYLVIRVYSHLTGSAGVYHSYLAVPQQQMPSRMQLRGVLYGVDTSRHYFRKYFVTITITTILDRFTSLTCYPKLYLLFHRIQNTPRAKTFFSGCGSTL